MHVDAALSNKSEDNRIPLEHVSGRCHTLMPYSHGTSCHKCRTYRSCNFCVSTTGGVDADVDADVTGDGAENQSG